MSKNFEYRGDLAQTTLPEMLYSVYRFRVPGILEVRHEGVVKKVYIKEGNVLHATSSNMDDSLGSYLLTVGRLSEVQFERTMKERQSAEQRYGSLLVENDLLSPAEVYEAIRGQVEAIVWSLFRWQQGEVTFQIGDFSERRMVRIQIPLRQVILSGIKRAPNAKTLVARLGKKETVFEPSFQTEDLIDIALDSDEYATLALVDGERTLYEVCTQGPLPAAASAKLMYAFQVLSLVRRSGASGGGEGGGDEASSIRKIRFETSGDRRDDQ